MKPNKKFDLSIRDIEIIEQALRAKAGRRGLAIAQGETSEELKKEMIEIQEQMIEIECQEKTEEVKKDQEEKQGQDLGPEVTTEEDGPCLLM